MFHFLALLAMLVYSVRVGFLVVLKEFDSTEKHQHTLQDMVVWWVSRLVPEFGRDSGLLSFIGVLSVALRLCTSAIMVRAGLLWVTGWAWVGFGVALAHVPRLCMKVVIRCGCRCTHM